METKNKIMAKNIFTVIFIFFFCAVISAYSQTCGDVNTNGTIDIMDALKIAQYYIGLNPPQFDISVADVSGNCIVDIVDALVLAQWYVGITVDRRCAYCTPGPAITPTPDALTAECPSTLDCPSEYSCGCYKVDGLSVNKNALINAGGNQYMMATAMMETEKMDCNYIYGDGRTRDAFNAGITKMNWYEARKSNAEWNDKTADDYELLAVCNNNLAKEVSVWNNIKSYWGSKYWSVHINGASGDTNPISTTASHFKVENDWIDAHLGNHLADDIRFWISNGADQL